LEKLLGEAMEFSAVVKSKISKANIILLLIIIVVLCDTITGIVFEAEQQFRQEVRVENFQVCDLFLENDFDDSHCKKHFPEKVEQLFACGEVVLPNPQQIEHVNLLIGINKEEEFQHINLADKSFTHGVFCREIPLPKTNKTGIYHLDVYLKRNIIASTDFTIQ
jgi:hypothetical protein